MLDIVHELSTESDQPFGQKTTRHSRCLRHRPGPKTLRKRTSYFFRLNREWMFATVRDRVNGRRTDTYASHLALLSHAASNSIAEP